MREGQEGLHELREGPHEVHLIACCTTGLDSCCASSTAPLSPLLPFLQLLAITHVTAIDMTGAPVKRDVTVIVDGDRIRTVGPAASTPVPAGATRIDGRNRYLIPGLWDMHVHTDVAGGRDLLSLYVANGVTGVRDMGGDWATIQRWRREIASGALVGPRIVASGPYLDYGPQPIAHIVVRTPADGKNGVDSLARMGVDFVKIHSRVPRDAYFAAAREARAMGLMFGGHVSGGVTVEEASDSGQRSLEHLLGFRNACAPAESASFATMHPLMRTLFGACTTRDLTPVYKHLARNGTWVTPTITPQWEVAVLPGKHLPTDSLNHYFTDSMRVFWDSAFGWPTLAPGADAMGRALFAKRLKTIGAMHAAGIALLAGTDAPMRNSPPGFGVHTELAYFVAAGLSPMAALRSATYEPARYLKALDSLGTLEPGKVADLVLLDADPLADIANTRHIRTVIARGRVYDSLARRRLLLQVQRSATH